MAWSVSFEIMVNALRLFLVRLSKIGIAGWILACAFVFSGCFKNDPASDSGAERARPAPSGAFAPADSNKTTAIGRAVDSARSIAATQLTAGQLRKLYTPQLATLQAGLSKIQSEIAVDPSVLAGDAGSAYQELRALVPELTEMMDALRDYEADGPTEIAGRLQSGFAKASELYTRATGHAPSPQ